MRTSTLLLLSIYFATTISRTEAQSLVTDSVNHSKAAINAIAYFNSSVGAQAEFNNGALYELSPPANKGSFYFQDKNYCVPSSINYNGTWYSNVPVLYDSYHDLMVSASGDNLFEFRPEKLSDILLLKHHFIYLASANLPTGFYDLLYDGKIRILAKRTKIIIDNISSSTDAHVVYEDKSDMYVKIGNKYHPVNSASAFLGLVADKRKELNTYISNSRLDYKNNKEETLIKLAAYYDKISN